MINAVFNKKPKMTVGSNASCCLFIIGYVNETSKERIANFCCGYAGSDISGPTQNAL